MVVTVKEENIAEKKHARTLKIVIRRLPPTITEQELLEQMSPMPSYDYFKFVPADYSLSPWAYSRAYVNLTNSEDVLLFRDRFNGYVFVDYKGNEFPVLVEYAPSQKFPAKKPKKDIKCNTIEDDPDYKEFLEELKNPKHADVPTLDSTLAEIEKKEKEFKEGHGALKMKTPLIEFIEWRKEEKFRRIQEKRRQKEEERRRREEERKKQIERENLRKQREKEKKEKEAAKKAAAKPDRTGSAKPERAPRFEKTRTDSGGGSKYDEDWDNNKKSYPETEFYEKKQKSSGKPSASSSTYRGGGDEMPPPKSTNKNRNNYAPPADSTKAKSKTRYKDKPSLQLYQPGKNRKLVENQEKPLIFKDTEDAE